MSKKALIILYLILFVSAIAYASADEKIRVLVKLKDNVAPEDVVNSLVEEQTPSLKEGVQKYEVRTYATISSPSQTTPSSLTASSSLPVKNRYRNNAFSTRITEEQIEQLENNPNIEYIVRDIEVKAFLAESVPIINATNVHNTVLNNSNLTGKNQTVCVIDTGVDYTHPDLGGCTEGEFLAGTCNKVIGGYNYCADDQCSSSNNNPMDNAASSHGTHVAGIIAANGTIRGVAPEAKIVALKVLNSSGSGSTLDVLSAVEWCVDNASAYNISAISISLGTSVLYSDYCDSENSLFDLMADEINRAVANNISVVIASGNEYNLTHIPFPACIRNAIPVGASTEADEMDSFTNRNFMVNLLAPGASINSTLRSNTYGEMSGTSMAAPHVSGAIALLQQYYQTKNSVLISPATIENTFNSTGTTKFDSETGLNFSRIDVYATLLNIDTEVPSIIYNIATEPFSSSSPTITLSCNVTDELILRNVTLYGNWSSGWHANSTNSSGRNNVTYNFEVPFSTSSNYAWNCYACDNVNCAFSSTNRTLITSFDDDGDGIDNEDDNCQNTANADQADADSDNIGDACDTYPNDFDNDNINDTDDSLTGNASGVNITNSSITSLIIQINSSTNLSQAFSGEQEVTFNDASDTVVQFIYEFATSTPLNLNSVEIISQTDNTTNSFMIIKGINLSAYSNKKTVYLNKYISSNRICIKDEEISSMSEMTTDCSGSSEVALTCDSTLQSGYNCTLSGTTYIISGLNYSGVREYTYTAPSSGSGGGGGSSGVSKTITFEGKVGSVTNAKSGDKYKFTIGGNSKTIKINKITGTTISFQLSIPVVLFSTQLSEVTSIDLEGDGISDLSVKVENIADNRVNYTVTLDPEEEEEEKELDDFDAGIMDVVASNNANDEPKYNQSENNKPLMSSNVVKDISESDDEARTNPFFMIATVVAVIVIISSVIMAIEKKKKERKIKINKKEEKS